MRSIAAPAMVVVALLVSACSPAADVAPTVAEAGSPTRFAPYVDASVSPPVLVDMADATGVHDVVLAFALATGGRCEPSWAGVRPLTDPALLAQVGELRARGGQPTVATGGASGPYLENACGSPAELARAYASALDAVGGNRLDVDVEADVPAATVVDALTRLQRERGTAVTLTLRVQGQDQGLEPAALALVRRAAESGLRFTVNPMVMNFAHRGDWAAAMVATLDAVSAQLHGVWPDATGAEIAGRTGMTLMIGRTDLGAVTTLADAATVAGAARSRGLASIGFWSVGRDNGGCPGRATAAFDCSGIEQSRFAFTEIFRDAAA
ncbi:hypothetical protein [Pseudonocardia acidicola]|uniref:Chitinase n=1 Tax=Pseudonocardia acidicola TaxID=2724939 RepID=A0ABX1SHN4_9PSEU|nr:hypothetical protein [Pseudonocardia acidicola]NMI01076.1 hypothetical protein [Pseudonocardia acidicola]